ncbi:hypothetical protein HI914_06472 [Erysiphe necator]|nr:hypothetical protein HI914_06472 [Erysiphe necator]
MLDDILARVVVGKTKETKESSVVPLNCSAYTCIRIGVEGSRQSLNKNIVLMKRTSDFCELSRTHQ